MLLIGEVAATDPQTKFQLELINESIVFVFVLELTLRFIAANKKSRFFRSYWIDILSVIPFFRPLRVLRVLRLMRVFRFGMAFSRRMGWLNFSLQQGAVQSFGIFFAIVILVLFGGIGLQLAEHQEAQHISLEDSLWWAVMSLVAGEPIGFEPSNRLGRIVTLMVMLSGLLIFAVLTGIVSALMVHRFNYLPKDMDIDELKNHIVICGWNRSGMLLIHEFQNDPETAKRPIVIVAEFEEEPNWPAREYRPELIYVIKGDFTRLDILGQAGLERASHAVVLADRLKERSDQDRDARSVLTALLIERINKSIFTSVELLNRDNEAHLKLAGVEEVVVADEYAARVIASAVKNQGLVNLIDELLTSSYGNQFYKIHATVSLCGMTFVNAASHLKSKYDSTLIGLESISGSFEEKPEMKLNPGAEVIIRENDVLLVIACRRPRIL